MTYQEYLDVLKRYDGTDSIREKKELGDRILEAAEALLHVLVAIYASQGKDFVDDPDYRTDRGWTSLEDCDKDNVYLHYSDRWAYGGECDIGIAVPMKYLDADARAGLGASS